jgi:hypothetical protein
MTRLESRRTRVAVIADQVSDVAYVTGTPVDELLAVVVVGG